MGEVVVLVLVVQVVVVVLSELVCVVDVRAGAVVHVHDMWLAVLRVVVEYGGQTWDGRWVRVGVGVWVRVLVLEWVRKRV